MAINNVIGDPSQSQSGASLAAQTINSLLQQQQQKKLDMAMELIKSGAYQPSATPQGPPPTFMQKLGQSFTGPAIGGPNMNIMGQNFQMQTPQTKMANLQAQLQAIQGMNGQQPSQGGSPMIQGASNGLPTNLPNYQVSPGDIDMAAGTVNPKVTMTTPLQKVEYQTKLQELKDKSQQAQLEKSDADLYAQSPEEIKASLMKSNPAVVRIGERIIQGGMYTKDLPSFEKNSALKIAVDKYIASQGVDEQALKVRKKVKQDYSPGGSIGKQLVSAGTIVQHMQKLSDAVDQLHNSGWIPKNMAGQTWARTTGQGNLSAMRKYELMRTLLSDEYGKYLKGGAPAEAGVERVINSMGEADPMDVQKQVLQEGAEAMAGRLGRYVSGWYDVFNRPGDPKMPSTILDPQTKEALKKMGMDDVIKNVESPENTNPKQDITDTTSGNKQTTTGQYSIGQIIKANGKSYKVTGGNMNDPDIEEVK